MPSMKVEGDSDGDGDMSGGETERSGGSSRGPDRDSSAEDADEPDSDDSSEMDECECERRRTECLNNLANLERQFTVLREQLYSERMRHVEHQLQEVRGGRSQEYVGPLRRLQENMRVRIEVAGVLKQMRIDNIKHKFQAEEQAAHQHFRQSEKWLAYESLKEEILEKIRKIEEERHTVDLWSCGPEWGRKKRKRQVTVSPPYIVYMLPDSDIMEDWRLVRKLLERSD
ncbi:breast cancer metastasis-suppressor 1-like protein isoform X1 [Aricia agestis]|uniref:breast cancer metastasis-suppressor 1-like protein isoform X1 n=1 Tax=Aricia agestis TaxID=91739 RepID=UPI001C2091B9|nr:breast cancer metastasis-suppressor 1-like protein isoform X1 [Aricia agestis]